mgnify:CR=1 FL=1
MKVGIDIEMIDRFKIMLDENKQKKVFTEREIAYFNRFEHKLDHIAGCFCAKEAVSKALKVGLYTKLNPIDIEILHDENGAPFVNVKNKKLKELVGGRSLDVSISHTDLIATAICIVSD